MHCAPVLIHDSDTCLMVPLSASSIHSINNRPPVAEEIVAGGGDAVAGMGWIW